MGPLKEQLKHKERLIQTLAIVAKVKNKILYDYMLFQNEIICSIKPKEFESDHTSTRHFGVPVPQLSLNVWVKLSTLLLLL